MTFASVAAGEYHELPGLSSSPTGEGGRWPRPIVSDRGGGGGGFKSTWRGRRGRTRILGQIAHSSQGKKGETGSLQSSRTITATPREAELNAFGTVLQHMQGVLLRAAGGAIDKGADSVARLMHFVPPPLFNRVGSTYSVTMLKGRGGVTLLTPGARA